MLVTCLQVLASIVEEEDPSDDDSSDDDDLTSSDGEPCIITIYRSRVY